jgi:hypothetical protein
VSRKHTEAEAIVARERRLLRQRLYQKRIRALTRKDHNYFWTDEQQRWLVNLFEENLPTAEIGRRNYVRSRLWRKCRENSFGKFVHVNGRRHVGRNFKTGETILKTAETIEISARRSVIFRLAKELRQVRSISK